MGRDGDTRQDRQDGVFRSSRRVTFVVRSAESQRRLSMSRVSRDPMTSIKVDVRIEPSAPAVLDVEGDWSSISERLEAEADRPALLRFECAGTGEEFVAEALRKWSSRYIVVSGQSAGGGDVPSTVIERELFMLLLKKRAAIVIDLDEPEKARLVSYRTVEALRDPQDAPSVAAAIPAFAEPVGAPSAVLKEEVAPRPSEPPLSTAASAPEPKGNTARPQENVPETVRLKALTSPKGFPDSLQDQLSAALGKFGTKFGQAMLLQVEYDGGNTEFLIGFAGVGAGNQSEIENAVNSVLAASRRRDIQLGIAFLEADDPMLTRISRVAQFLT